jgi:hypothetical protein
MGKPSDTSMETTDVKQLIFMSASRYISYSFATHWDEIEFTFSALWL